MVDSMDFDINEALKQYLSDPASVSTPDANPDIADADADSLEPSSLNEALEAVRDAIHENPDAVAQSSIFDTLQCVLK